MTFEDPTYKLWQRLFEFKRHLLYSSTDELRRYMLVSAEELRREREAMDNGITRHVHRRRREERKIWQN